VSDRDTEQEFVLRLRPLRGLGWSTPAWMRLRAALKADFPVSIAAWSSPFLAGSSSRREADQLGTT
jgi:hypothetical protein